MPWQPDLETSEFIDLLALQNALQYEGKGQSGSVIGRLMGHRNDLKSHAKDLIKIVNLSVEKANSIALDEGLEKVRQMIEEKAPDLLKTEKKVRREGLPDLPNIDAEKVVLRFAPNPNGPLTFGHSRGIVINSEYAKRYDGELILRFDDTDTSIKPPLPWAYAQIENEVEWLTGAKPTKVIIVSNRMKTYYEYAEKLIQMGGAYICTLTAEEFREYRISKTDSPCRDRTASENLKLWNKMLEGGFKPGEAVVRVKTDMQLKNPALRDWPALRLQDTTSKPHPRKEIGSKYIVWPLLDFQSAIDDYLEGVTHIIRGKDLMDSTRKQILLYEHFEWTYPETIYWGRVKIHEFGGFSTSGMRMKIDEGAYEGWDDPRLPTISSLQRRGLSPDALKAFWIELGLTQKDISASLATLFSHNTTIVDPKSPRLSFVRNPLEIKLESRDVKHQVEKVISSVHPEFPKLGNRELNLTWSEGTTSIIVEEIDVTNKSDVRLKEFANIKLSGENAIIDTFELVDGIPIIHWLPNTEESYSAAELITVEDGEIVTHKGYIESFDYPEGTIVQLERIGYAKIENSNNVCKKLIFLHN